LRGQPAHHVAIGDVLPLQPLRRRAALAHRIGQAEIARPCLAQAVGHPPFARLAMLRRRLTCDLVPPPLVLSRLVLSRPVSRFADVHRDVPGDVSFGAFSQPFQAAVAMLASALPRLQRDRRQRAVVESTVGAAREAAHRLRLEPAPRPDIAAQPGQAAKRHRVVGQAGGRYLVPGCPPQRERGAEHRVAGMGVEIEGEQPVAVERHPFQATQIAIRRG